jgi:hypothetical protein
MWSLNTDGRLTSAFADSEQKILQVMAASITTRVGRRGLDGTAFKTISIHKLATACTLTQVRFLSPL